MPKRAWTAARSPPHIHAMGSMACDRLQQDGAKKNLVIFSPAFGVKRGRKIRHRRMFTRDSTGQSSDAAQGGRLLSREAVHQRRQSCRAHFRVSGSGRPKRAAAGSITKPRNLRFSSLAPVRRARGGPCRPTYDAPRRQGRSGRALWSRRGRQDAARDRICVVSRDGLFGASVRQRERRRRAQRGFGGTDDLRDSQSAGERGARRRDQDHRRPALARVEPDMADDPRQRRRPRRRCRGSETHAAS